MERGSTAGASGWRRDRTCGGADAAERDDALAGDPEVVVREEAAAFPAQTLHAQTQRQQLVRRYRHDGAQMREGWMSGLTLEKGAA
jgi:hypothetical protein